MNRRSRVRPPALAAGARVALITPAGGVSEERIAAAISRCHALGLEPELFPGTRQRFGYLAGADDIRAADLQAAFDRPDIDAVWAIRGGYGTLRLLEHLDLSRLRRQPRPYIGFSDNTAILMLLHEAGIVGFHGPHPGGDFPPETEKSFCDVLFEGAPTRLEPRSKDPKPIPLQAGVAEAPLIGGNLAILASLCGTRFVPDTRGHILFLEDVSEPVYRIDRLLMQLRLAGLLDGIAGLAFGRFTDVGDVEPGRDLQQLLREVAYSLRVPAIMELPIGHVEHNSTLSIGVMARLDADNGTLELLEAGVERK